MRKGEVEGHREAPVAAAEEPSLEFFGTRPRTPSSSLDMRTRAVAFALLMGCTFVVSAQIGGKTAADGPFTLDDAEDLDLVADGVGRAWVSDSVPPVGNILSVLDLSTSSLTLATGQTPLGVLAATVPEKMGVVDAGFGVPMPGVVGASTDDSPGDITSFDLLTFNACFDPALPNLIFDVILESNASVDLPRMFWNYTPAAGTAFQRVEIDLRSPGLVVDAGSLTLEDLLSNTRFLFFNFFAGPVPPGSTLSFHIDDIRLEGTEELVTAVEGAYLYR
jgi:hypothetical protein